MNVKREKIFAFLLAALLLIVGVVCYAVFPVTSPEEPVRIMLKNSAGDVLFSHKEHASEDGYGLSCEDCHHMWEGGDSKPEACGNCHEPDSEDPIKRSDAFHLQCKGCHEEYGAGAVNCSQCHVL